MMLVLEPCLKPNLYQLHIAYLSCRNITSFALHSSKCHAYLYSRGIALSKVCHTWPSTVLGKRVTLKCWFNSGVITALPCYFNSYTYIDISTVITPSIQVHRCVCATARAFSKTVSHYSFLLFSNHT